MARSESISYERNYIHSPKWRLIHASAFRTAHCLWTHCDDFGLVCLQPITTLRYFIERRDAREDHIANDLHELQEHQILYSYKHAKHGIIGCMPDYTASNHRKFPKQSLYLPIPDNILFAEPDYAETILSYQAKSGGPVQKVDTQSDKPTLAQGIAFWNAFASEHSREGHRFPQASITPSRIAHWNARVKEPLFDLATILQCCIESDWLTGKVAGRRGTPFVLTFDYLTDGPNNYVSILEGKYRTTTRPNRTGSSGNTRGTFVPNIDRIRGIGQDPRKP